MLHPISVFTLCGHSAYNQKNSEANDHGNSNFT
jgi:hypothetical protein